MAIPPKTMEHNPYTPPKAEEISFLREAPPPRPVAVWLFIIAISIFIFVLGRQAVQLLLAAPSYREEMRNVVGMAFVIGSHLLVIALLSFLGIAAYQASPWSRWLGAVAMVGSAVLPFVSPDTTQYANDAQRAGGFVGRMFIYPALMAWWVYAFAFSGLARQYFSRPDVR